MNIRHQHGHLRSVKRKVGPPVREYLWRETDQSGNRVRRNLVIGTLEEYPTEELAQAAVNGLRTCINEDRNRQPQQPVFVSDLIDHYLVTELSEQTNSHSHSTRIVYRVFLKRWIRSRWGSTNIRDVRTIAVESWLRQLQRNDGEALANSSKAKIRNLMRRAVQSCDSIRMARTRKESD
ncbi:MAG TPA: hypothetical protein VJM12_08600 [Pyrinomonadaceae bacterium]|nr:hypothetical protein [Pyrinomonadaceae bacterium]